MRKIRKWTALFCAGIITAVSIAGCGNRSSDESAVGTEPKKEKENAASGEENTEKSMGRYLERELTLPEEISQMVQYPVPYIARLENGDLLLVEKEAGRYLSGDLGETWEAAGNPWEETAKGLYVTDMALSPDGGAAMIGLVTGGADGNASEDEATETGQDSETAGATEQEAESGEAAAETGREAEAAETAGQETENSEAADDGDVDLSWKYYYYDAEGNETALDLSDIQVYGFGFDRQNRLYAFSSGKVYRLDVEKGTKKELFATEGYVDFACFTEKYMVGVTTRSAVVVYDIEEDILLDQDEVLQDFIEQNVGLGIGGSDTGHTVVMTAGEQEDVIYFAFSGGLYRHAVGGAVIEQIIDGSLSNFGNPSGVLMDMMMLPENEFAVLYRDMELYRYTYDPNVPTVPEEQISVYSLRENTSMRQAVSMFQKAHQEVYVRCEIGMTGDNGMTREDALRNLNTRMMAGEGPDILLLDGLPRASYEEKGILAEVSGIADTLTGDAAIFPNIVEACREDGKLYALPIRIQLPMMAGKAEDVRKVKDLDSLAALTEELREENPEGALLYVRTPEQLLYILSMSSSAAWSDEAGAIDEKALTEFLTAAKRIWQAETAGVPPEELGVSESGYGALNEEYRQYYGNVASGGEGVVMGIQQFAVGRISGVDFDFDMLTTLAEQDEDFGFDVWNGQVQNGFYSNCLVGICANSMENETAVEFYRYLFGKELQDIDLYDGLPVNMASFEKLKDNPRAGLVEGADDRAAGSIGASTPDGDFFGLELLWPTEEEFEKLKGIVSNVSGISTGDERIADTVYEIGARALEGGITPEEAVQEIVKKSAIYLAE